MFSVVVPFFNESENLPLLIKEVDELLTSLDAPSEVILVNDGSTDVFEQPERSPLHPIRWLHLTENSGQSAALYYGMQAARGEWVILMDADLQNDPFDVPKLWERLCHEKVDLITGIRVTRHDVWHRRITSRFANTIRQMVLRDHTSDTGCTLKVMRKELAQRFPAWNGMHRFIPALALAAGYQISEAAVSHRPRHSGKSKVQGSRRAIQVVFDLLGMIWLTRRQFRGRLQEEKE